MTDAERMAEAVREACVEVVLDAYEEAGIRGLCAEGRWEYAVEALRRFELTKVLQDVEP